jgi:hypothetical protein
MLHPTWFADETPEPGAGRGARGYVAADGTPWRVYEYRTPDDEICLVFESREAFRRVCHFPRDWRALSDAELEALSWER